MKNGMKFKEGDEVIYVGCSKDQNENHRFAEKQLKLNQIYIVQYCDSIKDILWLKNPFGESKGHYWYSLCQFELFEDEPEETNYEEWYDEF